ncbi:MAG: phage tail tape measure protein [Chloroflexi bacterium]|nr:phage tail tape measure protein [Chloroflexota bacterium]
MTVQLGNAVGRIIINTDGVNTAVNSANSAIGKLRGGLGSAAKVMTGALVAGTTTLVGGLGAVTVSGIKMAASLEQSMADIAAVMGLSADQVKLLEDEIISLGLDPNLKVSTEEAASAIEMLGRNGLTTTQILDGAAHATVLLANATGGDFATSANLATSVMSLWGIEAKNMTEAVNGITSVVTNSRFGIDDMSLAIAQGGGVAATAGVSFEDFNTSIAAMSPLFNSGSDAGTSFKTALMRLAAPTDKASAAMNELGLEFYDAEGKMKSMADISAMMNQALYGTSEVMVEVGGRTADQNAELGRLQGAYTNTQQKIRDYELGILGASMTEEARAKKIEALNASLVTMEGNMSPLLAITGDMTTATKQLTEKQRTQYLTTIFGSDAMRAMAGIAESGAVAYETAEEAAKDLGLAIDDVRVYAEGGITEYEALMLTMGQTDAAAAAETRMNTLSGALEVLEGIVDAIKIQIGQFFGPFIREKVEFFTKKLEEGSTAVFGFIEDIQAGMDPIHAMGTALLRLGIPPGQIAQIREYAEKFIEFKDKILELINQAIIPFVTEHKDAIIGALVAIGAVIMGASVIGAIAALMNPITAVIAIVGLLGAAWTENWGGIRDVVQPIIETVVAKVQDITGAISNFIGNLKLGMDPINAFTGLLSDIGVDPKIINKIVDTFNKLSDWFNDNKGAIRDFAENTFGRVRDKFMEVAKDVGGFVTDQFEKVSNWFNENRPLIESFAKKVGVALGVLAGALVYIASRGQEALLGLWYVIKPILGGIVDLVLGVAKSIMQAVTGDWSGAWGTIKETVSGAWEAVKSAFDAFLNWVTGWFGTTWEGVKTTWSDNWEAFKEIVRLAWEAIKTTVTEKVMAIRDGIAAWFENIKTAVTEKIEAMRTAVVEKFEAIKAGVLEKIRLLFEAMGLDFDAMRERWRLIWEDVKLILMTVWETIYQYILLKLEEIQTWLQLKLEMIRNFWIVVWEGIKLILMTVWETIYQYILLKLEEIQAWLQLKLEMIRNFWIVVWDEIKAKLSEVWDAIKTAVEEKVQEVYTAVTDKIEEILSWIEGKVDAFKSVGADLLNGLKDGVLGAVGSLISAVTGAIEEAIQAARDALMSDSPSRVFMEIGNDTIQGMILGIDRMRSKLTDAVSATLQPTINMGNMAALQPAGIGGSMGAMTAASPASFSPAPPSAASQSTGPVTVIFESGSINAPGAAHGVEFDIETKLRDFFGQAGIEADIRRRTGS